MTSGDIQSYSWCLHSAYPKRNGDRVRLCDEWPAPPSFHQFSIGLLDPFLESPQYVKASMRWQMIWQVGRLASVASTNLVPSSHNKVDARNRRSLSNTCAKSCCRPRLCTTIGHTNYGEVGRKAPWAEWLIVSWYSTYVGGSLKAISLHEFHWKSTIPLGFLFDFP